MSIRLKPLISAVLLAFSVFGFSQGFTLTGKIIDKQQKPVSFVNVTLFETDSETFLKGTSTDDNGVF